MPIEAITSTNAPIGPGPYSPAMRVGDLLFISAQSPIDPQTHELQGLEIEEQARRALDNVGALLKAGGSSFSKVVKINAYLSDPADYDRYNEVYASYVDFEPQPARTTVSVSHIWYARQKIKLSVSLTSVAIEPCNTNAPPVPCATFEC
jgi:2-iminobutanoate/2-iminopropanoate deaminase